MSSDSDGINIAYDIAGYFAKLERQLALLAIISIWLNCLVPLLVNMDNQHGPPAGNFSEMLFHSLHKINIVLHRRSHLYG